MHAPQDLPELKEGDPMPGAAYFNALRRECLRSRVQAAVGCGLTADRGPSETVIGFVPPEGLVLARTGASTIPARTGTPPTHTPGSGTATLVIRGAGAAMAAGSAAGVVNHYATAVPANTLVWLAYRNDRYEAVGWEC